MRKIILPGGIQMKSENEFKCHLIRIANQKSLLMLALMATILLACNSCTIIGAHIGRRHDQRMPITYRTADPWEIGSLTVGAKISVTTVNDTIIQGCFNGIQELEPRQYLDHYQKHSAAFDSLKLLPPLGEIMTIYRRGHKPSSGSFAGFVCDLPKKSSAKHPLSAMTLISWSSPDKVERNDLSLEEVKRIEFGDQRIEGKGLRRLGDRGMLPLMTSAEFVTADRKMLIPLSNMKQIEIPKKKYGEVIGALIGATIDITVVVFILWSFNPPDLSLGFGQSGY
jgi:hypothetical protein